MNFEISLREALTLLILFGTQVLAEFYIIQTYSEPALTSNSKTVLYAYTAVYAVIAFVLFVKRRKSLKEIIKHTAGTARSAFQG